MAYKILRRGFKRRKDFKTQDQYLDYIFDLNKTKIISVYSRPDHRITEGEARAKFKSVIESNKKVYDTNVSGALKKLEKTRAFTPEVERLQSNMWTSLKNYKAVSKFQQLTRDKGGKFTKFDTSKLVWDRENKVYVYDNKVSINFNNSPQQIILTNIQSGENYMFGAEI